MKMKINRRGSIEWEGDKLGRIILAVICIVGLILLGAHIYNIVTANNQLKQATASLNKVLSDANSGFSESQIYNPSQWYLTSFPATSQVLGTIKPAKCLNAGWSKCICIYNGDLNSFSKSSGSVDFTGTCAESDFIVRGTASIGKVYALSPIVNFKNGIGGYKLSNTIQISSPFPITLEIDQTAKTIKLP